MNSGIYLALAVAATVCRCGPGRESAPNKRDQQAPGMALGNLNLDGQSNLNLTIVQSSGFVSTDETNVRRLTVVITEAPTEGIGARGVYIVFRGIPKPESQFSVTLHTEGEATPPAEAPVTAWLGTAIERSSVSGSIQVVESPSKVKKDFDLMIDLFSVIGNVRFKAEAKGPVADPQSLLF